VSPWKTVVVILLLEIVDYVFMPMKIIQERGMSWRFRRGRLLVL
jgi:hypothetical protein